MKIKKHKKGIDGVVRPIEDRPLVCGREYLCKMKRDETYKVLICSVMFNDFYFHEQCFDRFKVQSVYYDDVLNKDGSELKIN